MGESAGRRQVCRPALPDIKAADIPRIALPDEAGEVGIIAGKYADAHGPAATFTPINVWDLRLRRDGATTIAVPAGHTTIVVVLSGTVLINDTKVMRDAELAMFERDGSDIRLQANSDAKLLVLTGAPIDEPVVGYGPFVMNSTDGIRQAFADFQAGKYDHAS